MLEKDLKKEMKKAMKSGDSEKSMTIKIILGEIPRLNKKKNEQITEEEINGIIKKLIKSELIMLKHAKIEESKSEYLSILRDFLPPTLSREEIEYWIEENIDFNDYKNKMQAMGKIIQGLKGVVDGNTVKKVIEGLN